jgi:hypothetical protein
LKSVVEFLNKQMDLVEVLLVEARIYEGFNTKIVVPRLFGYSKEAHAIRRTKAMEGARGPIATDWDSFAANAGKKGLDDDEIDRCRKLYDACIELRADIAWGRGTETASFSPRWKALRVNAAPFSVYANGLVDLHFPALRSAEAAAFRDRFAESLGKTISLSPNHLTMFYQCPGTVWMPKVEQFVGALKSALHGPMVQLASAAT